MDIARRKYPIGTYTFELENQGKQVVEIGICRDDIQNKTMNVVIVANGAFPRTEYPRYVLASADFVVCCDGALQTLEKHSVVPDVVIGDLDSVCSRALKRFPGTVVRSSDQQTNDLTKAFDYVMRNCPGTESVTIIGATGRGEAHTIGNLSLLMEYQSKHDLSSKGISLNIVSDYCTAFAITDSSDLHVGEGRKVSLFTPDPTLKISSKGLVWPTDDVVFDNWWKATLNKAQEDVISLRLSHPSMVLVILD